MSMSIDEFVSILKQSNLPVTYYQFPIQQAPELPYLIYWFPESDDLYADDLNFQKINSVRIELYTAEKDFTLEEEIADLLNNNGLTYEKSEQWINSEQMWMILYETTLIIKNE